MKTQLFGEFTDTIHRAIKIQRHYLIYLNSRRCNAWRIDQEVKKTNDAQKATRDAHLKHINEHGCGEGT